MFIDDEKDCTKKKLKIIKKRECINKRGLCEAEGKDNNS
jgi:hypothetical protein